MQELIVAGLDGVMTVMKVDSLNDQHENPNCKLDEGAEKNGVRRSSSSSSSSMSNPTPEPTVVMRDGGGPPQGTKAKAYIPKYRPIQAKWLGPIVALTSGKIFPGSEKNQVLACTVDGLLHIFDLQCNRVSEGLHGIDEVSPTFSIAIPNNVSAVRVLDSVMMVGGSQSPIIVLVTNETDKGQSAEGFMHFTYLQLKDIKAEPDSPPVPPCLVSALKYSMGGEITSLVTNPYPPLSVNNNPEVKGGRGVGNTTSGVWTIAVGFEGGGIAVLTVKSSDPPSAGEDGGGRKLEVKLVPMKTGGGLPMSTWGWNGATYVFGPFRNGEGFGVCTVDGRVSYIEVKVEREEEEERCSIADADKLTGALGHTWSTSWCHQTHEAFFYGGALPLGSSSTVQLLLRANQCRDGNNTMKNAIDNVEPFAVCSWGGVTAIFDAEGKTSPIFFDPRDFIESPLRAFTCGCITLSGRQGSRPALIYSTGAGEIVIYHSIWDEIGLLNSEVPSFEERIFRGGGLESLRTLLSVALDRLDEYEKIELSQPQWKEDGELAKSTTSSSSPLPQAWKDLAALSRFLLERGPLSSSSQTMVLSGFPFVSAMRESIIPILNELESCYKDGGGCHPSLYDKPNLQRVLNRLALASRTEKLNM